MYLRCTEGLPEANQAILEEAAATNDRLRHLQGPEHDCITGHIMLHPARRLFEASNAEHAFFGNLHDVFMQHAGFYRGVFQDPKPDIDNEGVYYLRSGPTTEGCHYPSRP